MIADVNRSRAVEERLDALKAKLYPWSDGLVERLEQGFTHYGMLPGSAPIDEVPSIVPARFLTAVAFEHIYGDRIDLHYICTHLEIGGIVAHGRKQVSTRQEADEHLASIVGDRPGPSPTLMWRDLYDHVHDLARNTPR